MSQKLVPTLHGSGELYVRQYEFTGEDGEIVVVWPELAAPKFNGKPVEGDLVSFEPIPSKRMTKIRRMKQQFKRMGLTRLPSSNALSKTSRLIGRGAVGLVYESEDGKSVYKRIPYGTSQKTTELEIKSAQMLMESTCPATVVVYDIGFAARDSGDAFDVFIQMERLEGMTLTEYMSKTLYTRATVIRFATDALESLKCIHDAGWVHRDINPNNMMVYQKHLKLIDFGIANKVGDVRGDAGTPGFIAPLAAEYPVKADIWSVGTVFTKMLDGAKSYEDGSTFEFLLQLMTSKDPNERPALEECIEWLSMM